MYRQAGGMDSQQHRPQRAIGQSPRQDRQQYTSQFVVGTSGKPASQQQETDPHRIAQRQKQIDYGKNTLGYQRYTEEVPRHLRQKVHTPVTQHPDTPDVKQICSKRSFDGQVKKWRRQLHFWDPVEEDSIEPVLTVHEDTVGEPDSVRETSPFFSPKKQKTETGHKVQQRCASSLVQQLPRQDREGVPAPAGPQEVQRKQLSTGSKRTHQDMEDNFNVVDSSHRLIASQAQPSPAKASPLKEKGNPWLAAVVSTREDTPELDDFGPDFEFS